MQIKKVFILGSEGNGLVIAAAINRNYPDACISFLSDDHDVGQLIGTIKSLPVVGKTSDVVEKIKEEGAYAISAFGGITNPQKNIETLNSLGIKDEKWLVFIDKTAIIPFDFCKLGRDVFIGPLAQLSPDVTIGNHCSVFGNAFVGHDSKIGEFCHLATNSVVGSSVTVGNGVHIGSNSVIREHIRIGDYSIIGAGAVVVKDVPENAVVVGNPAKVLRVKE